MRKLSICLNPFWGRLEVLGAVLYKGPKNGHKVDKLPYEADTTAISESRILV